MARKINDDFSNSLTMLHGTVMHTSKELKEDLTRGVETLRTAGEEHQRRTESAVVSELSRMRGDLRDTKNRLTANGAELSDEVHAVLESLQTEIRALRRAAQGASVDGVSAPDSRSASIASEPAGQIVAAVPAVARSDGGTPGSLLESPATTEAALTEEAPVAASALEVSMTTPAVPIPGPRAAADDTPAAGAEAEKDPVSVQQTVLQAEEVATVVHEALQEELAPVREALGNLLDQLSTQREVVTSLATQDQLEGLAAGLDGLPRAVTVTTAVAELGTEVRETRTRLEELLAAPEPVADDPLLPDEEQVRAEVEHSDLLRQAARVSRAALICHRDIWDFVVGQADRHPHFRTPQQLSIDDDDRVAARLSGRSLIAVLSSLWATQHDSPANSGDWALATTLYTRINVQLAGLEDDGDPVTITLDDRTPARPEVDQLSLPTEDPDPSTTGGAPE